MTYAYIGMRRYADPDGDTATAFFGAAATPTAAYNLAAAAPDLSYHGGHNTALDVFIEKWDLRAGKKIATFEVAYFAAEIDPAAYADAKDARRYAELAADDLYSATFDAYPPYVAARADADAAYAALMLDASYVAAMQARDAAHAAWENSTSPKWSGEIFEARRAAGDAFAAVQAAASAHPAYTAAIAAVKTAARDAQIPAADARAAALDTATAAFNAAIYAIIESALANF